LYWQLGPVLIVIAKFKIPVICEGAGKIQALKQRGKKRTLTTNLNNARALGLSDNTGNECEFLISDMVITRMHEYF